MPPEYLQKLFGDAGITPDEIREYIAQMTYVTTAPQGAIPEPAFTMSREKRATIEAVFEKYRDSQPAAIRDLRELVRTGQLPSAALEFELEIWQDQRDLTQ